MSIILDHTIGQFYINLSLFAGHVNWQRSCTGILCRITSDTREFYKRFCMAHQATYTVTSPPTPGLDPPPGVIPNFHQPYTLLPYVELTIAGCIAVTTLLVAARVFVKTRIVKKFLWEDWTCVIGWVGRHIQFPLFFYGSRQRILSIHCISRIHASRTTKNRTTRYFNIRCGVSSVLADTVHLYLQANPRTSTYWGYLGN